MARADKAQAAVNPAHGGTAAPTGAKPEPAALTMLLRQSGQEAKPGKSDPAVESHAASPGFATAPGADAASMPTNATPIPTEMKAASGAPATGSGQPAAPVAEQVAVQIARHAAPGGTSHFEIRLDPADLGRIEVRLSIHRDGHVHAVLAADRPETVELLNRDIRGLERALQDAGLKTESGSLSFSLRQDGRGAGQGFGGSAGGEGSGGGQSMGGRAEHGPNPFAEADTPRAPPQRRLWRQGGVDIRI